MRPEEIRAQISSLNDELKDTNKSVELRHSERDLLLKEIEELKVKKIDTERLYNEEKERLASIRYPQEQKIQLLNKQIEEKQGESDTIIQKIAGLETRESSVREKIKELKDDKAKLQTIRKELEEAEKNRPLIEAVKKELLETVDNLNEAKVELDITRRENERVREDSKEQRKEVMDWATEQRIKITDKEKGIDLLKLDYENKHKDLRIIRARLKKLWPKDRPFPTLDW